MEVWKTIVGYEGFYEVSNFGRVRSLTRKINRSDGTSFVRKGRIKSQTRSSDGYLHVKLSKNGIDKRASVHRLVATAFIGNPQEGEEINHINFIRNDNSAKNLEWVSHTVNIMKTKQAGRHISDKYDFSGKNNPNYGNNKLKTKYGLDKELSKAKQGRPRSANGMARKVALYNNEMVKIDEFGCMIDCANYLFKNQQIKGSLQSASTYISKCANSGKPYKNHYFKFI